VLRYYAIATCIVLAIAVGVTAWIHRDLIRIRLASTNLRVPPKVGDAQRAGGRRSSLGLTGDAPWALSALPDCLLQTSYSQGGIGYVRSKLPAGARELAPGATITFGPCTISVGAGEVMVQRGLDRLRIPPLVTLYRAGDGLALLRIRGGTSELRIYRPSKHS
jgi:hypothetical protein